MVFFNDKKFACESCIKGHRSSACHHTDRPLFEIKKKGRPVSQCPKCRELRHSKKLHSKCTCDHKDDAPLMQPLSSSSTSKPRYIPIIPALPNGLKDAIAASQSSTALPPDSRQRVDSLLNPCNCTEVWKCRCKVFQSANSSAPNVQISDPLGATLARAAVVRNSLPDADSRASSSAIDPGLHHSRPATPANIAFRKRQKQRMNIVACMPGPDLPPIRLSPSSPFPPSIPDFPSMPSMSEISLLAGSGCTCGVLCKCPGCPEHTTAADTGKRCGDGCGACIDPSIEVALPRPTPSQESTGFLDRFFAQAAALPPPPAHRKMNDLNPMNTRIFSQSSSSSSQPLNFGVINLPKLECDGRCDCSPVECRENCEGFSDVLDDGKRECCGGSV